MCRVLQLMYRFEQVHDGPEMRVELRERRGGPLVLLPVVGW